MLLGLADKLKTSIVYMTKRLFLAFKSKEQKIETMLRFKYAIRFSKLARRLTMRLESPGFLKLTAPKRTSIRSIEEFIRLNSSWIEKQHQQAENLQTQKYRFIDGSDLPYKGSVIKLETVVGKDSVFFQNQKLVISAPGHKLSDEDYLKGRVIKWYREQALTFAVQKVSFYQNQLGVAAKSVRVRSYRSRWGACSSDGNILFNWQLVLFSEEEFNYVVAHEVCHLMEMNHSPKFYAHLKTLGFDKSAEHKSMKSRRNLF